MSRYLNREMAEKVMGWKASKPVGSDWLYKNGEPVGILVHSWLPTERIRDTWLVVERILSKEGWEVEIYGDSGSFLVTFKAGDDNCHHAKPYDHSDGHGYSEGTAEEKTICLAICKAALEVVKGKT